MKNLVRSLVLCMLMIFTLSCSAFASTVDVDKSSFTLKSGENTCKFNVTLHADSDFAGAEFGIKPSASDVTVTAEFADVKSESTVRTVKDGVTYFGFFAGSNKFGKGDYKVAEITCTYAGSGSRSVSLVSSKIVSIDENGDTKSDTSMPAFAVSVAREGSSSAAIGGGGGGAGGGGGVEIITDPTTPLNETTTTSAVTNEKVMNFTDVKATDWFYNAVKTVFEKGILTGTSDTEFSPNLSVTRAMAVTVLWRLENSPEPASASVFTDVAAGSWYAKAVAWAAENNIVNGTGENKFSPDMPITREQLASIIYRYEQLKGNGFTGAWMFNLDNPDAGEISDFANEAMHWCVMKNVIGGNEEGKLLPKGTATRAEFAKMLSKLV